jgi:hypothetical protein
LKNWVEFLAKKLLSSLFDKLIQKSDQKHSLFVSRVVFEKGRVLEPEFRQSRKRPQVVDVRPALDPGCRQVQRGKSTESILKKEQFLVLVI